MSKYPPTIENFISPVKMHIQGMMLLLTGISALPTKQRLSLAEWGSYSFKDHKGPGTYAFGYDLEDPHTNNVQFRQEERHLNGSVTGSYGYVEPNGHVRIMHYIADSLGYRVREEKPPPVNFHPHHEAPNVVEQDVPVFEGEFHPVTEENAEDPLNSIHPIQFPTSAQFPPPVRSDEFFQNPFSNDVSPNFSRFPTKSYLAGNNPLKADKNHVHDAIFASSPFLTQAIVKPFTRKMQPTHVFLLYANKLDSPGGFLRFKI